MALRGSNAKRMRVLICAWVPESENERNTKNEKKRKTKRPSLLVEWLNESNKTNENHELEGITEN